VGWLILDGGWGLEGLSRRKIMGFVNGRNPQVKPGWKERLLEGEIETVPIEKWEREVHKGHVASIVSMFRYAGVYDQHEDYRKLVGSGVEVLVILGDKDQVIEAESTKRKLAGLGWKERLGLLRGRCMKLFDRIQKRLRILRVRCGEVWGSRTEMEIEVHQLVV